MRLSVNAVEPRDFTVHLVPRAYNCDVVLRIWVERHCEWEVAFLNPSLQPNEAFTFQT